jgi:two-component system sensor histidine kinase MtrB
VNDFASAQNLISTGTHRLLGYVADLELEVDRLRKYGGFVRHEVGEAMRQIAERCAKPGPTGGTDVGADVGAIVRALATVLQDLRESSGYHPAHDQVVAIAVRPLAEQVFRSQKRMTRNPEVTLRVDLEVDSVEWFPARLRHILENLFANAIRNRDPVKTESWVMLGLKASEKEYQFLVSDNGIGMPGDDRRGFELLSRAAPLRDAGLGVGLSVIRALVEQSGGSLMVRSEGGRGTEFVLTLPRYDVDDYLV